MILFESIYKVISAQCQAIWIGICHQSNNLIFVRAGREHNVRKMTEKWGGIKKSSVMENALRRTSRFFQFITLLALQKSNIVICAINKVGRCAFPESLTWQISVKQQQPCYVAHKAHLIHGTFAFITSVPALSFPGYLCHPHSHSHLQRIWSCPVDPEVHVGGLWEEAAQPGRDPTHARTNEPVTFLLGPHLLRFHFNGEDKTIHTALPIFGGLGWFIWALLFQAASPHSPTPLCDKARALGAAARHNKPSYICQQLRIMRPESSRYVGLNRRIYVFFTKSEKVKQRVDGDGKQ